VPCQQVFYGYVTMSDERRIAYRDSSQVGGDVSGQFTYCSKLLPDSVSVAAATTVQAASKPTHFCTRKCFSYMCT
jgi:hypothetical protein